MTNSAGKPHDAATVPMTDKPVGAPPKPKNVTKVDLGILPPDYITSDGRFQILETLGKGGMGIVYRAMDRVMNIEVAMKFLLPGADETAKGLFETEARAMAKLAGCGNIVTIFNIGEIYVASDDEPERIPFISCEYIRGGSVQDLVGKCRKEKSTEEILKCIKIGIQACNGLARAHQEGILHRDIKPSNLLLRPSGTVKISDFGLAKFVLEPTGPHTARDRFTIAFIAPEQKDDRRHKPTAKIDIYQLGVTLYYLLTGCFPHETKSQKPSEMNPNIPEKVSDYVLKMTEFRPEDRPVDCKEVADTLQAELDIIERAKHPAEPIEIIRVAQFRNIRHALKEKVENGLDILTKSKHRVVLPRKRERQRWYATLLMRPYFHLADGSKKLLDTFNPIYFAENRAAKRIAFSDWEKDQHLISRSLSIKACCAGLPIRWYRDEQWSREEELFHVERDIHHFIRFFALKNIKWARFEDPETNIIKENYATDMTSEVWPRAVGWVMETDDGDKRPMSQDIQTEILIPIYNPVSKGSRWVDDSHILGVANFEWEEKFTNHRIEEVGNYLANLIQDENCFALSEFTCDVLPNITLSDYDDNDLTTK